MKAEWEPESSVAKCRFCPGAPAVITHDNATPVAATLKGTPNVPHSHMLNARPELPATVAFVCAVSKTSASFVVLQSVDFAPELLTSLFKISQPQWWQPLRNSKRSHMTNARPELVATV